MPIIIMVNGVPFAFIANGDGYYVYAVALSLDAHGSPTIVKLDTPLGAMSTNLGDLYQAVITKLP